MKISWDCALCRIMRYGEVGRWLVKSIIVDLLSTLLSKDLIHIWYAPVFLIVHRYIQRYT
jgi:hypothetical protein